MAGKQVVLRTLAGGTDMKFAADGRLLRGGDPCPWTLCSKILVQNVNVRKDKLVLDGVRLYLSFELAKQAFQAWNSGRVVRIELSLAEAASQSSARRALNAVFLTNSEPLTDIVPAYWSNFLKLGVRECKVPKGMNRPGSDSGIAPPKLTRRVEPAYREEARQARLSGTVLFCAVVSTDGRLVDVSIGRPLGMGLDEEAYRAVTQWRFEPAHLNGTPVPVAAAVEVTFVLR
jgi:TonB family protein